MKNCISMTLMLGLLAPLATADSVSTVDARVLTGSVVSLDAKVLTLSQPGKKTETVPLGKLLSVEWAPVKKLAAERLLCKTFSGCEIPFSNLSIRDNRIALTTQAVPAPLRARALNEVATLVFPKLMQTAEEVLGRCATRGYATGPKDLLVIEREDGKYQSAAGVLLGITAINVQFRFNDKDRTVARTKVRALFLSRTIAPIAPAKLRVTTTGGATLACRTIAIAKTVTCTLAGGTTHTLTAASLASAAWVSDSVAFVSSLKPTKTTEHGLLDVVFPHRLNRSVAGGPIRLGGKTYTNGLGLHSFCELDYDLVGGYSQFLATVGIDDSTKGRGDAQLTILADGKPLKTMRVKGGAKPVALRLALTGVKRLTIRVGFGEDKLGVGDHVNLANARLVK